MRNGGWVICALAAFVLALCAGAAAAWDGTSVPFIIGNGVGSSASSPVMIENAEQLAYLAEMVNSGDTYAGKYFRLVSDIDLSGHDWVPIGIGNNDQNGNKNCFSGTFDGGGKVIRGLTIISDDYKVGSNTVDAIGLFGFVFGADKSTPLLKDIRVEDAVISVDRTIGTFFFTGILAGQANRCAVKDCVATGEVRLSLMTAGNKGIGGLIGRGYSGAEISRSFVNASIEVESLTDNKPSLYVGGLVGMATGNAVECGTAGSVSVTSANTKTSHAGGLIGYNAEAISVERCFSTSAVAIDASDGTNTTTTYAQGAGGLIGYTFYNIDLVDSFSLGSVSARGYKTQYQSSCTGAGGLVGIWGHLSGSSSSKNSFVARTSYAYGRCSETGATIGGLFGLAAPNPTSGKTSADDCFWLADSYEAPVDLYGRYVNSYGSPPLKNNDSKGLTAGEFKKLPKNFKDTIWGYSTLDGNARPQLRCFVDGETVIAKLVTLTTSKVAITAGETKRVSYSALGLENEASFSLSSSSVGGVSIAPDASRPGTFVITAPNETNSGIWTVEISARAASGTQLPTKTLSIVVGDGTFEPVDDPDDDGDEGAGEVEFEIVDLPSAITDKMPGKTVVTSDDFKKYGHVLEADPDLIVLAESESDEEIIAQSKVVSYDLGGDVAAMMGARFETARADDSASLWYAYADGPAKGRSAPVKIIGDGGIWSWDAAAALGLVEFKGSAATMRYIITNEPGADQSPYEVGGWIVIPDGKFNDSIVDPIFITAPTPASTQPETSTPPKTERPAHAASSGGGCSAGASLAAAAILFALRRRR